MLVSKISGISARKLQKLAHHHYFGVKCSRITHRFIDQIFTRLSYIQVIKDSSVEPSIKDFKRGLT